MDNHDQIHNDIKPQNYLVKHNGLDNIEIVLTDFGLAGSDSKGGTPIFASPECLADAERKDKSSDIFSLGRVFLFMTLPKEKFLEFLFVPLVKGGKEKISKLIEKEPIFCLIAKMMRIKKRINLETIRNEFKSMVQMTKATTVSKISEEVSNSTSENTNQYINMLGHFS